MSNQTFFVSPKFDKKPIYNSPTNKYQEFTNVYVYSIIVKIENGTPNCAKFCDAAAKEWSKIKNKDK
ncbi:3396_t:CDS:1, partial [Funneliformis geosporum]